MRTVWLLEMVCLALLSGCATHSQNVRCDRRLQPINPPAAGGLAAPRHAAPPPTVLP